MIKIYSMKSCPDCSFIEAQIEGNGHYELIDIGEHVRHLKAFLRLRDADEAFRQAKEDGSIGIPCFVLEDGCVTLCPEEAGLKSRESNGAMACSLDGKGC